jgi:hypothetical protein
VTTVGQVVTTGQQLVVVTPRAGTLQVEALVANLDIGFVKLGQKAAIKVDAFPFTRFGLLNGKVVKIASAAISEQHAKRALANATAAAGAPQASATAPGQPESFVFPVTVALDETAMTIDNAIIPLTPGMTVTVEIKTDSRRVIDISFPRSPKSPPKRPGALALEPQEAPRRLMDVLAFTLGNRRGRFPARRSSGHACADDQSWQKLATAPRDY